MPTMCSTWIGCSVRTCFAIQWPDKYPVHPETLPVSKYHHPIYQSLPIDQFENYVDMTLRVREICRHDRDTSPINNQQRNLDAHIGSYIFYEDLYRSNPLSIGMLLARDSILGIFIPSSISLPASIFTRFVIHHPATNSLVTLLARLLMMCITERAQRYLSDTQSDKS